MDNPPITPGVDSLELDPADGQQYIEELKDRLVALLLPLRTTDEITDRLLALYPQSKLVTSAIDHATETRKNHKHRLNSSSLLQNLSSTLARVRGTKTESEKFKMAIIEYIISDVLGLAGEFVKRQKGNFIITRSDIRTAMHADKDFIDMFLSEDKNLLMIDDHPIFARIKRGDKLTRQTNSTQTYRQKLRKMIDAENSFMRGLKLIMKVFRDQLVRGDHFEIEFNNRREVDLLFCNIDDLYELSTLLLSALEDALESVGHDDEVPYVGSEILDLAQAEEFYAYFNFAYQRLSSDWRLAYSSLTEESRMEMYRAAGLNLDKAVKNLLPNYLLNTIIQFFVYFESMCDLHELSKKHDNREDEMALKETISILIKTKRAIEDLIEADCDPNEIEPLDRKEAEILRTILDRRLDAELQHERSLPLPLPPPNVYRFSVPDSKENIQFEDLHDNRTLSSKDVDRHLRSSETDHIPVIRYATLIKLVERLTYHKYQPNIVDSFLVTYRSFISDPEELLDLLIERFKIPDPAVDVVYPNFRGSLDDLAETDRRIYKNCLKRFRQEYSKPVKMRVINVLKSWIRNHYYDFERHPTLLGKLHAFLDEVYHTDKVLRSLITSIKRSIEQKKTSQGDDFEVMLSEEPPHILWGLVKANEPEKFDILTLHPVEFARQLTLVEYDLFKAIKPSELINVRDFGFSRDEDRYQSSPNLSRMTRHFTLLSYWIRKNIVETENLEQRSIIFNRAIEIMGHLLKMTNFTGLLSVGSAIESAPISRLQQTHNKLTSSNSRILEDYRDLNENHQKLLQQKLKECNPPCIPYVGYYQTKLIHAKEGNKTFLSELPPTPGPPKMINFTKQRIRAGLVAEIANYQNTPYCFRVQPEIRRYIESIESQVLDSNMSDVSALTKRLDDYLFEMSERIEPKSSNKSKSKSSVGTRFKWPSNSTIPTSRAMKFGS